MSEDVKNAIQEMGSTFEEFKKVNDERLEKLEKGESTAYVDEKLAKVEAKMDSYEDINQKLTIAEANAENIKSQLEKLETVVKRPNSGFESKQVDEYMEAFDRYCRKGLEGLSDTEKKALTVSNDSTGGYLAPPEYVRELIKDVTDRRFFCRCPDLVLLPLAVSYLMKNLKNFILGILHRKDLRIYGTVPDIGK